MGNYIFSITKKRIVKTIQILLEHEGKNPRSSAPVRDDVHEFWLGQYWIVRESVYHNEEEHLFVMRYHIDRADGHDLSAYPDYPSRKDATRVRVVYNGRIVFDDAVERPSDYYAAVRGPWRLRLEALAEGSI